MKLNRESRLQGSVRSIEALHTGEDPIELVFDPRREISPTELERMQRWCSKRDLNTNVTVAGWAELRLAFGKKVFPSRLLGSDVIGKVDRSLHPQGDLWEPTIFYLWQLEEKIESQTFARACHNQLGLYKKYGLEHGGDGWLANDLLNLLAAKELQLGEPGELEELIKTRITREWGAYRSTMNGKNSLPRVILSLGLVPTCFPDMAQQIDLAPEFWEKAKKELYQYITTDQIELAADVTLGLSLLARALARRSVRVGQPLPPRAEYEG